MFRFLVVPLFLLIAACTNPAAAGSSRPVPPSSNRVEFSGKVVMVRLEGGFCGLVANDGRRFEPLNLPAGFCRDGLAVRVRGELISGGVTMRMWGRQLRIEEIRRQ